MKLIFLFYKKTIDFFQPLAYSPNMSALLNYINEKNAKTAAWVAGGAGRWATSLTDDLSYWAAAGVTTPDELDKHLLVCDVFESTRSVYGYKPSWAGLMSMSLAELGEESQRLAAAARADWEREQREQQAQKAAVQRAFQREEWNLGAAFASVGL